MTRALRWRISCERGPGIAVLSSIALVAAITLDDNAANGCCAYLHSGQTPAKADALTGVEGPASRGTCAGRARALLAGWRLPPSVRRGDAARRRAASIRLRISRLRPAYALYEGGPVVKARP